MPRHLAVLAARSPWVLAVAFALGLASPAACLDRVQLRNDDTAHQLAGAFEYLEDSEGSLTIEQVASPELADRWSVSQQASLNVGLTSSAMWLRFTVDPESDASTDWMLEIDYALNDRVEFFLPQADGTFATQLAGNAVPHSAWSIPSRVPRFALHLVPGLEQTYYLRVVSGDTMLVPLRLATPQWLAANDANRRFWLGVFLGAFVTLGVYHLILFVYLRDVTYLYYVAAIFGFVGYQTAYSGLVGQFVVPEWILLKQRILHLVGVCTLISIYTFARSFTDVERRDPGWNGYRRLLTGLFYALLPLALILPLRWFNAIGIVAAIAGSAQLIIDSWRAWRSGYTPAGYFLISWIWVGVAGVVFGLRALGVVPNSFAAEHSLQIGSLLSMVSVAFSLSDRITVLQRELEAGFVEKQNLLAEVQSLNTNLEARIRDRTTELEEQAVLLADQARDLAAASRHKSDFLASMSHELRTPLNAVIGFSEVLVDRAFGELNEKQAQYLDHIHASGRHLLSLINDILDLAKIEAGRIELEFAEFHLPTAVSNSLVLMKERALRGGVELKSEIADDVGMIFGDERKIKQVLINLLSNAVKFTPNGGSVVLTARLDGEKVQVSVSDTGIGIAPEDQELVFEEFRQVGTDARRRAEGTGLGLALSKRLVEAHQGTIWLKSKPGEGSTFSFALPIAGRPAESFAADSQSEPDSA